MNQPDIDQQLNTTLAIFKHTAENIICIDQHLIIRFWNPSAEFTLGYPAKEKMGTKFEFIVASHQRTEVLAQIQCRFTKKSSWMKIPIQFDAIGKHGQIYPVELQTININVSNVDYVIIFMLKNEELHSGNPQSYSTEQCERIIEQRSYELKIAKDAAVAANKTKSEFLANMSHELRTPLHAILSFSEFGIRKSSVPPEKRIRYFQKIQTSGKTLLALLNNLLDLAKLETGKIELEYVDFDLKELVETIVDEFDTLCDEKNIAVSYDTESLYLTADMEKVKQIIRNLMSNAVKFSSCTDTIFINLSKNRHKVILSISDQGQGIPETELEAVFDKYVQSSKTRVSSGGTGLGLAICKEIVELHHGKIWAENNPDGGSKFTFELPLTMSQHIKTEEDQMLSLE